MITHAMTYVKRRDYMSQMVMTKYGYMSKAEARIIGKLAKEEHDKKTKDDKKKRGRYGDM